MDVSDHNDPAEDFLGSLEKDFRHFRLYHHDELDDVDEGGSTHGSEVPVMGSWNDMIRSHMDAKPSIPQSEHNVPRPKTIPSRHHTSDHSRLGTSDSNASPEPADGTHNINRQLRADKLAAYRESRTMASVCQKGWNLSKGWSARPPMFSPDIESVEQDIERFSNRVRAERNRQVTMKTSADVLSMQQFPPHKNTYLFHTDANLAQGNAGATAGSKTDVLLVNVHKVKNALYSDPSPGPRYNTRIDSSSSRIDKQPYPRANQRSDTRAKDISFGYRIPDPQIQLDRNRSPGPIYFPNEDRVRRSASIVPKLYAGGREFFGSVYVDVYSKVSPGPAYALDEPHRKMSHVFNQSGTSFVGSKSVTDIRSQPKLPPR